MYQEDRMTALPYRRRMLAETDAYLERLRAECGERRKAYFTPDLSSPEAYEASLIPYRRDFIAMLGRPLTEYPAEAPENAEFLPLGEDELGKIERVWIEALPGLWTYGLLFTPDGDEPYPFVTALHGGQGTCEIVSSFYNSANYNDLVQRLRGKLRAMVFAPQLMLWGEQYNEDKQKDDSDHIGYETKLRQVGGSMAALEIFRIMRGVDWLIEHKNVDRSRMGILGLSYGGFYTLFTAAADPRYKAALSSGFFNDRTRYCWADWVWKDSASRFLDAEAAKLVCPRTLITQIGESDQLFEPGSAEASAADVRACYEKLGLGSRYRHTVRPGGHQFSPLDDDLDFFVKALS